MAKKQKLKTHKATAKRFKITGGGKVLRTSNGKSHLRRRTPKRTKAKFTRMQPVAPAFAKKVRALAPYLKKYKSNPPS